MNKVNKLNEVNNMNHIRANSMIEVRKTYIKTFIAGVVPNYNRNSVQIVDVVALVNAYNATHNTLLNSERELFETCLTEMGVDYV